MTATPPLAVLALDQQVIDVYGRVRAELQAKGTPIGPLDTLIAAHAIAQKLTVVTSNVREFRRVRGLRCEDWAA